MNNRNYKKYLKYRSKCIDITKQTGGAINFADLPINIYHAFNERFSDIIPKIEDLKSNGITHIQLSPIQKCRNSIGKVLMRKKNMKDDSTTEWWLAYQPINYNIGNFYGSEEDVRNIINKCKTNHLEIVIDIVINHISALEYFEYPIWNILLIITGIQNVTNYPDFTLWDVYFYYHKMKGEKSQLEKYLDGIDKNSAERFTINRLFMEALIDFGQLGDETVKQYNDQKKVYNDNKNIGIMLAFTNPFVDNPENVKLMNGYIDILFEDIKKAICDYLTIDVSKWDDNYYDILTAPYYCTDSVSYGHNCWLGQALPQLNQKNKLVRNNILNFLQKLSSLGIKCLRIDAATHMQPEIIKFYIDYFNYISKNQGHPYIYSELINVQGTKSGYKNEDYIKYTHVTDYNLILNLLNIFCMNCGLDKLNILDVPSRDMGSVVFSATHDLIEVNGKPAALSRFGTYNNKETDNILLMICYLIQRIYNVPLILNEQYNSTQINVKECCKFRKYLADNGCTSEEGKVNGNVFSSEKFNKDKKSLGKFYMNVSNEPYKIDEIEIPARNIFIKIHKI